MAARTIDVPGRPERSFVTTEEAAEFCGVAEETFLKLVGHDRTGEALPGVAHWMRPYRRGKKLQWDVYDVWCLRHLLTKWQEGGGEDASAEKT